MWDILPREQTFFLTFISLLGYVSVFLLLQPAKTYPFTLPKARYKLAMTLVLLLCLLFFSPQDWFGYYKEYLAISRGGNTHMEDVYEWLAVNAAPNYIIWRFWVWGCALLLLVFTIERLPIPPALCILAVVVMMFLCFVYTRTSLAYMLMFYGCSLLYKPYKNMKFFSYLLSVIAIGCSYFFHKSALFGISMIVLAVVIKKIDWKIVLLFLLITPFLLFLLRNQIANILLMDFEGEEGSLSSYMSSGQYYLQGRRGGQGIGGILLNILKRSPAYIMAFICFRQCNNSSIPKEIRLFMRITFFIVVAALLCRLNLGANTYVLYYRFLNYSFIPISFCFSYLYSNGYHHKLLNWVFYIALTGALYEMVYIVYVRYVNGPANFGIM